MEILEKNTEEWWHRMFEMHAKLVDNYDADILEKFKQELDTIPYAYAKSYDGLEIGAPYLREIASWYDDVSKWSAAHGDYDAAVTYLERALDYYCDPLLDYDDDFINEAKERMDNLVSYTIIGIFEECHELYNENSMASPVKP